MKTTEQDNTLNAILATAIAEAQRAGDDMKVAAEDAAKAYVAGLVAANPTSPASSADRAMARSPSKEP